MKLPEIFQKRPRWWLAWQDYPHGSMSERHARELNRYAVELENEIIKLHKDAADVPQTAQEFQRTAEAIADQYPIEEKL